MDTDSKHCSRCDETKLLYEFYLDKSSPGGRSRYCADCRRNDNRRYLERHSVKLRKKQNDRYNDAKELLIEMKSSPCVDCGISYPYYIMEFDHRDPSQKVKTVAQWCASGYVAGMLEEIDRCDLTCSNCHRERTHQQILSGAIKLGAPRKYN